MNWVDMLFFHAEVSPQKTAIACEGAVISYGRLARAVLSLQRRIRSVGLNTGDMVGILVQHPIEHFSLAYALYRLNIASISLQKVQPDLAAGLPCSAIFTDRIPDPDVTGTLTPGKIILVDDSWYQEQNIDGEEARTEYADPSQLARLVIFTRKTGEAEIVQLSRSSIEAQLVGDCLSATTPSWDRAICVSDLSSDLGFRMSLLTIWLGRTICLAHPGNARQLISAYKHEFLFASVREAQTLINLQQQHHISVHSLRGAYISGDAFPTSLLGKFQALFCNNLVCSYGYPKIGPIAYALANRISGTAGAVGFVSPWLELRVLGRGGEIVAPGHDGEICVRPCDQSLVPEGGSKPLSLDKDVGWIATGHSGHLLTDNMLIISNPQLAA